jgi:hypothetical protein
MSLLDLLCPWQAMLMISAPVCPPLATRSASIVAGIGCQTPPTMLSSATSSLLSLRPMTFVPVLLRLLPQATSTLALILKHVL